MLNANHLDTLPAGIPKPSYDRRGTEHVIVHIGVGGFHRAHQALYLDKLLSEGHSDWSICGMGVMDEDKSLCTRLKGQDYLYTLMVKHPDGAVTPQVIGSIMDYVFAPENPTLAIEKMADPRTKIVSLTITEGGYNFDQHGNFIFETPAVQWDLAHPDAPKSVFGLIAAALRLRKERNIPAFTLLSCDNVQHNGDVLRKMMLSFAGAVDKELARWIDANVSSPNSMVDRITPVTVQGDIDLLREEFGIGDACPVTCEPFVQWVLEDDFPAGRPQWELAGAQFVRDIEPYEKIKLRLLNAGHSLLGFLGSLLSYKTIDESMGDPLIRQTLRNSMDQEVTPVLGCVEGIDLTVYKDSLIERFGNPEIKDQLSRICTDASNRLPKFVVPTISEQLERGGQIRYATTVIAAWCRAMELYARGEYHYAIRDVMIEELARAAVATAEKGTPEFLKIAIIFGDLHKNPRFADEFMARLSEIRTKGVTKTLLGLNAGENE